MYKRSQSSLAKSVYYEIYNNFLSLIIIIVIIAHIYNTILLVIEYKKFLKKKKTLKTASDQSRKKESLVKFILIQSFLYYTNCMIYVGSNAKMRYDANFQVQYDPSTILFRYVLHFYQPINFIACALLIFRLDEQLNKLTKSLLRIK